MAKRCPACDLRYDDDATHCFVDNAALVHAEDPWIGSTLAGRYLIESVLGQGGMATVYRARNTLVSRPVAVKIMSPRFVHNRSMRERFRREAKNSATLAHPNIIEIYDFGEGEDGAIYLVMELLRGESLEARMLRDRLSIAEAVAIAIQIAQGLARAHDFDVIHRDLKPDNIFLCARDDQQLHVKILDFGIARSLHDPRLTNQGEVFGTPHYMAPERVTSIDAGPSADLYALGVILFEMLTGKLPFYAPQSTGYLVAHVREIPPHVMELNPDCPPELDTIVDALLAKHPDQRPVDAHQLIALLQAVPMEAAAPSADKGDGGAFATLVMEARSLLRPPTMPPITLDRWRQRAALFEEMLWRAWPQGAPLEVAAIFGAIQSKVYEAEQLRGKSLGLQHELERLDQEAREKRERLGFALQSLGEDLSHARESERSARHQMAPYEEDIARAQAAYLLAFDRMRQGVGPLALTEPDLEKIALVIAMTHALEAWGEASAKAKGAQRWVEEKTALVQDLEFQIQAIRAGLAELEAVHDDRRGEVEAKLIAAGESLQVVEGELQAFAGEYCAPIRDRPDLREYFERLQQI